MRSLLLIAPVLAAWQWYRVWWTVFEEARVAMLAAAVCWSYTAVLMTEALSHFHGLSAAPIAAGWLLTAGALTIIRRGASPARVWPRPDWPTRLLIAGCGGVLIITLVDALIAPPNTVDVMLYHQPRILHWLAQRSVEFFPAHNTLQLWMPPAAEYISLHLQALAGGDWTANLPAWMSSALCALGASWLAARFGLASAGQAAAALLVLTLPEGILTATGAKNDYVLALWLVAFAVSMLVMEIRPSRELVLLLGCAAGLAIGTKGTAYVLLPPLCLLSLGWSREAWRIFARLAVPALVLVLTPMSGTWFRNMATFGSPLGQAETTTTKFHYFNAGISPVITAENFLRNTGLHLGAPSAALNSLTQKIIASTASSLGLDLEDPRSTWLGTKFEVPFPNRHEATEPNLLHFLLLVPAMIATLWTGRGPVRYLSIALLVSFLLFCTLFRWQPWHTRLHLPMFILWMPAVAWVLARLPGRVWVTAVPLVLLVASARPLLENSVRPLWPLPAMVLQPRAESYFNDRPFLRTSMLEALAALKAQDCRKVGLDEFEEGYLGAVMSLLPGWDVREVNVQNPSKSIEARDDFHPCAVVCVNCGVAPAILAHHQKSFSSWRSFGPVLVFGIEGGSHLCELKRISGWMQDEEDLTGKWNWIDGAGRMLIKADGNGEIALMGEAITAVEKNSLVIQIDRGPVHTTPAGPLSLTLQLKPGQHDFSFSSALPPVHPPGDLRAIGIGLKNFSAMCH